MNREKCANCKWRVIMSYTNGKVILPSVEMCHYNWKNIEIVRDDECHFKAKRESRNKEVTE